MKKYLFKSMGIIITGIFIALFFISSRFFTAPISAYENPFKIGSKLKIPGINLKANSYVDDMQIKDVTGDGVDDTIILSGTKDNSDDVYSHEHTIIVQNGSNKKYSIISSGLDGGYEGKLIILDFNGDKVPDIMTEAATGGSGGTYYYSIASFKDGKPCILAAQHALSQGAKFEGHFKDGYMAQIKSVELQKAVNIDISCNKEYLIDNNIYDNTGKLLKNVETETDGFQALKPVDEDGDGTYELEGIQKIWAMVHLNEVTIAKTTWKFENNRLILESIQFSTFIYR